MNSNTVRQLLDGSEALNQMKKDIDSVVKMVTGMIREDEIIFWKYDKIPSLSGRLGQVFRSDDCEWEIRLNDDRKFDVECRLIGTICTKGDIIMHSYSTKRPSMNLCDVQRVHQCLEFFVEKMAEAFPNLPNRWQPLLDAATAR